MRLVALALLAALATPALADSQLVVNRPLSDDDFYKAVACGAPPGGDCAIDLVRWPDAVARDLPIGIAATQPGFARTHGQAGARALDAAIAEINRTGSALRLRLAEPGETAPIQIWFSDIREGEPVALPDLAFPQDDRMEGARVYIWWNEAKDIDRAVILLSRDLLDDELNSVVLEELTQALGFLTDLEGSTYAESSIFSETSNAITRLEGQDRMALRRHYPR